MPKTQEQINAEYAATGQSTAQLAETAGVSPAAVAAQNPNQSPDSLVGGAVMNPVVVPPPATFTLSNPSGGSMTFNSASERDAYYKANSKYWSDPNPIASTSDAADAVNDKTGASVNTAASSLATSSQQAYDKAFGILDTMAKASAQDRADSIANIEQQRAIDVADTATGQRLEKGATTMGLARMGGYLGGTGSGTSYMNSLAASQRFEMTKLEAQYAAAIEKAKAAWDMKDIDLANKMVTTAQAYQADIEKVRTNSMDLAVKANELMQFERDTDLLTLGAWAEQGYKTEDIPEPLFAEMDKAGGYRAGTAKGLYEVTQKNKAIKDIKDAQDIKKANLEQATSLHNILKTVPAGQPVIIDGFTYYGTSGLGDIEVDETTGEASVFSVGADGKITQTTIGNVGATKDGWVNETIGGEVFRFNPSTGEFKSYFGPKNQLNEIVPTGTYKSKNFKDANGQPLPFQCGELINEMTGATVGSTLAEKMAKIDKTIKADKVIEGNTIVFGGSSTGHVAAINSVYTDPAGRLKFVLSEANYKSPGTITHDREVYADDPSIKGFMKTAFKNEFASGPDSARLEAAIARENTKKTTGEDGPTVTLKDFIDPLERSVASDLIDVGKNKDIRAKTASDFSYALNLSKETGDPSWVRDEIRNKVIAGSFAAGASAIEGRNATISGLEKAQSMVEEMVTNGKNLDIFNGTYEQIYNKLGATGDPALRELAAFIRPMMMDYRKTQTGVAFSEKESVQYEELFPNTKQTPDLFKANVSGLVKAMRNADESLIRTKIGDKAYEKYFIDPVVVSKGTKTSAPRSSVTASDIANAEKDGWAVSTNANGTITFTKL